MSTEIDPAFIADVRAVASKLKTDVLSRSEYFQHGRFTMYQVYDGGRTWEDVCGAAGLKTKKTEPVSDDEYFSRLSKAVEELGRYPKAAERKKYGLNFSKRRYHTLPQFIHKAVELNRVPDLFQHTQTLVPTPPEESHSELASRRPEREKLSPQKETERPIPPIPLNTERRKWERTGVEGFPYAPHDELGVAALFGILCAEGRIKWQILELNSSKGIDITCYDDVMERTIRVELKHTLSKGSWNHRIEDLDWVVCWENRWPDFPKPVLVLSNLLKKT